MCSINEEESMAPMKMSDKKLALKDSMCRRCLEHKAQVVLRATDPYCGQCFLSYGSHKFRSTIGKVRAVRANDNVLLAYSGGLASGTMVKLVQQGTEEAKTHRRLIFNSSILFIDEGELLGLSETERLANRKKAKNFAENCGMKSMGVNLEYSLVQHFTEVELFDLEESGKTFSPDSETAARLRQLFEAAKTLTAKEDLLWRLKLRLLSFTAEKLSIKKVFLGLSGTRLASRLLSAVAQGRGSQIGDEIGFTDSRSGVTFLRPMREFVDKEVGYMAHYLGIESITIPALSTKASANASIERLMEEFVVKLQVDFPGTISTLFRTGDKLASTASSSKETADADVRCLMCKSVLENDSNVCSAASARHFSELVSRFGESGLVGMLSSDNCCSSSCSGSSLEKVCCKTASELPSVEDWNKALCYGCQLTMKDMKTMEHFPLHMSEDAKSRGRREKMRQSIEQFLL